ncbi:MAG TPA: nucleotidyltransferase family protein [Thermoanaerobaculia bacterium]|nr:nucleotidyltransferase family protein [Thermoanaerobaculia bacterium]
METARIDLTQRVSASPGAIADFCRKHRIRRLSLFGSVLREDFRPESDIDVLVEFEKDATPGFFSFIGMELELSALFGRKVDLLTAGFLSPYFREDVIREARPLHVAA